MRSIISIRFISRNKIDVVDTGTPLTFKNGKLNFKWEKKALKAFLIAFNNCEGIPWQWMQNLARNKIDIL